MNVLGNSIMSLHLLRFIKLPGIAPGGAYIDLATITGKRNKDLDHGRFKSNKHMSERKLIEQVKFLLERGRHYEWTRLKVEDLGKMPLYDAPKVFQDRMKNSYNANRDLKAREFVGIVQMRDGTLKVFYTLENKLGYLYILTNTWSHIWHGYKKASKSRHWGLILVFAGLGTGFTMKVVLQEGLIEAAIKHETIETMECELPPLSPDKRIAFPISENAAITARLYDELVGF